MTQNDLEVQRWLPREHESSKKRRSWSDDREEEML